MGRQIPIGIGPQGADLDENTGKSVGILLNLVHRVAAHILGERNRPIHRGVLSFLPAFEQLLLGHAEKGREPCQKQIAVLHLLAQDRHAKRGAVVDQKISPAVIDGATRSGDGDIADAISFRQGDVAVAMDDLQIPEADDQQQKYADGRQGKDQKPSFYAGVIRPIRINTHNGGPDAAAPESVNGEQNVSASGRTRPEAAMPPPD